MLTIGAINKDNEQKTQKAKENFGDYHFHNILRFFHVLPNFPFPNSQAISNYYLQT